jgi:hypothetical protein
MARKQKTIHYIYKTTCNVTGMWYIGMHSTSNLEDGYMGSGKRLRYSIRKYGVEKHIKEILEILPSREELILREIEIVNKELISDGKCMNLKEGGSGGFSNEEHKKKFEEGREWGRINGGKKSQILLRENLELKKDRNLKTSNTIKKKYIDGWVNWDGKLHSEETKQLMSEKRKGTGTGENNSQYGTCWITKGGINKKIKKEDLELYLNEGWLKGRK